ncbi:MAG: T9SS type A sorting domain-containing protein [Bacteroidales bacterium]|jgi:aminopeptidase N|nr:T9SS type A sorting domain-containing protein [Bacteroidales bacterium]
MKKSTSFKIRYVFITQVILLFFIQSLSAQTKADTIHVSHYDINLEIRDFTQQQIKGFTELTIKAKIAPIQNINLHLLGLTVDSVKNDNNLVNYLHQGQELKIDVPFLEVGQSKTIRVYYQGKPVRDPQWGGFYFNSAFAYNMGVGMGSLPHSFGRVWFPCIDEFTDKSTYTFNITTDADKKAVCGGMLVDSTDFGDAKHWKWELPDPIPSYLASVAVGDYQVYKDTFHSVSGKILPIEIYANPATMPKVPGSFVNLKTFIHTYEKRWGACRWQRVGYVVVPFNGGAMEHATNIGYPQYAVTGNTSEEDLISHELAHSWFGNLITCSTPQNMWINEGFATYGEYLCYETQDTTLQKYKTEIKDLHLSVLSNAHRVDGGYFALDNIPTNKTYGITTYDKGGLVAYTLRYYMGDELYFSSIKQLFDENKFSNMDSEEFFDKLSQISGIDLYDFYLGWVHQPGFLNFSIDSIKLKTGTNNIYKVAFKQRLHHAEYFANNNLIDVEFVSASGERCFVEKIRFSGEHEIVEVELPFEPVFWAIDPNRKQGLASPGVIQSVTSTGIINLYAASFRIQVDEIKGESILWVEHNTFSPTPPKNVPPSIIRISGTHFWRVGFLKYNEMQALYSFNYDLTYDRELLKGYTKDDLALLYRRDASHDWQIVPASVSGGNQQGRIIVDNLLSGEYTLAIVDNVKVQELEKNITLYPNPAIGELWIRISNICNELCDIVIYDIFGRVQKIESIKQEIVKSEVEINISQLLQGVYFVKINTKVGTIIKKVVII